MKVQFIPFISRHKPLIIDSLTPQKSLPGGKYEVQHVTAQFNNKSYALKIFPRTSQGIFHYNKESLLMSLSHPHVIKYFPLYYPRQDKILFLTEYAQYGDFFDLIKKGVFDQNEILIRTYFRQFIEGLEHIHSNGVAHLDIKLENLMLGSDYMLKIIDFDQAQLVTDNSMTSRGTQGYRPLEVLNGECVNLTAVDIYAAGIILYAFKAKEFTFIEKFDPEEKDIRCYTTYVKNKEAFWLIKNELKGKKDFFNDSFIQLVNGMLHENPSKRMKIKEIKNTEWYKGQILNNENLKEEMKKKLEVTK